MDADTKPPTYASYEDMLAEQARRKAAFNRLLAARWGLIILSRGGNLHGVNRKATATRRRRNKVAKAMRKRNR